MMRAIRFTALMIILLLSTSCGDNVAQNSVAESKLSLRLEDNGQNIKLIIHNDTGEPIEISNWSAVGTPRAFHGLKWSIKRAGADELMDICSMVQPALDANLIHVLNPGESVAKTISVGALRRIYCMTSDDTYEVQASYDVTGKDVLESNILQVRVSGDIRQTKGPE